MDIALKAMEEGYVGTLNFTFEGGARCHEGVSILRRSHPVYCAAEKQHDDGSSATHGSTRVIVDPGTIRGCDEIEPIWYNNLYDIPLHRMFADDSLWLTMLLGHYEQVFRSQPTTATRQGPKLMFDGWFHFHPGGTDTNRIMHHYIRRR